MIRNIPWLWKQMTGPRVSAFRQGIFFTFRAWLDKTLDYLRSFSIDTANDSHLTLIGMCMGITRPMITQSPEAYFLFTRNPEYGNTHGVSLLPHDTIGGMFIDALDPQYTWSTQLAPKEEFRKVLKATRDSKGVLGSLVWIIDVVHAFINRSAPSGQVPCKVRWYDDQNTGNDTRNWGDIEVLINTECISATSGTLIAAMLQGIFREVLGPLYWVDVNLVGNIPAPTRQQTIDEVLAECVNDDGTLNDHWLSEELAQDICGVIGQKFGVNLTEEGWYQMGPYGSRCNVPIPHLIEINGLVPPMLEPGTIVLQPEEIASLLIAKNGQVGASWLEGAQVVVEISMWGQVAVIGAIMEDGTTQSFMD